MNVAQNLPLAANLLLLSHHQPPCPGGAVASAVARAPDVTVEEMTDPAEGSRRDAALDVPHNLDDPIRKPYAKVTSSDDTCDRFSKALVYVSLVTTVFLLFGAYVWTLVYEDLTWIEALLMIPALAATLLVWFMYSAIAIVLVNGIDITDCK